MHLSLYRLAVTAVLCIVFRLGLNAQVAMPIEGFESVGFGFSILERRSTGVLYLPSVLHGMLESTDDGRTWLAVDSQATFSAYKQSTTLLWENDTTMYARVVDGFGRVRQIISTDFGRTWKSRPSARIGVKNLSILVDGTVIDEYRFDISTNFGRTWKSVFASYDTAAYHYPAILVAPHVASVWDSRGNWWEVDCVNDTAIRHRIKDRQVYGYRLFEDGSYIAVATDSWRWYSKDDSLLRKQVDTVINGDTISLGGSKLVTTGERWTIVTRNARVVDVTTPDIIFVGEPSAGVARSITGIVVRDERLIISCSIGMGNNIDIELSEYNTVTKAFRIGVRARNDMIGDAVFLSTITRLGTPIVLTSTANIIRYNAQTGDWTNCPVTPLTVAPQHITVVGAIPTRGAPGFALVTSIMQPYRITALGEFVVDTTRLPEGSFSLRSVGHTLRTTCHRIITTPKFFWRNGYDMMGTSRVTGADTVLCRDCHAYMESAAGLTFSGTRRVLRKNPSSVSWDTLTIDTSLSLDQAGYVSDLVESTIHNTVVVGLRGYDVQTDGFAKDSVLGGMSWTNDLGSTWYPSETTVALPYVHSVTKVGNVLYAVASNAVFSPEDVGPDKDVGAMIVDSVAILRSLDGGYMFDISHLVRQRRALHMHDMRVLEHGGRLYTCLQDQRIWVSDDGIRWDEDIDQPLPQGNVLSLTGIGDSVMILATTKGAFILEKTIQVDVETPAWQPLTSLRYNTFENALIIAPNLGAGELIVTDLHGRVVEQRTVDAFTSHVAFGEISSGMYGVAYVTNAICYRLLINRIR